jgi:DNA replication protein DnaC
MNDRLHDDLIDGDELPELKDSLYEEDRVTKVFNRLQEIRSRYPLKLTREECLAMKYSDYDRKVYYGDSKEEGKYEVVEDPHKGLWNSRVEDAVMAGNPCPACKGSRTHPIVYRGTATNFYFRENYSCKCVDAIDFQKMVNERLPRSLRRFSLENLAPSPHSKLPLDRQKKEMEFLRKHPDDSYFFLGKPGTSKSTFSAALFRHALRKHFRRLRDVCNATECLWYVDWNRFLDAEVAYTTSNDKEGIERLVTARAIERAEKAGYRPVLLIEEVDKRSMTAFAANALFTLLKCMDDCEGQLIVTTNRSMQEFHDFFLESDIHQVRVDGDAIIRRLTDQYKINVRDYHKEERQ